MKDRNFENRNSSKKSKLNQIQTPKITRNNDEQINLMKDNTTKIFKKETDKNVNYRGENKRSYLSQASRKKRIMQNHINKIQEENIPTEDDYQDDNLDNYTPDYEEFDDDYEYKNNKTYDNQDEEIIDEDDIDDDYEIADDKNPFKENEKVDFALKKSERNEEKENHYSFRGKRKNEKTSKNKIKFLDKNSEGKKSDKKNRDKLKATSGKSDILSTVDDVKQGLKEDRKRIVKKVARATDKTLVGGGIIAGRYTKAFANDITNQGDNQNGEVGNRRGVISTLLDDATRLTKKHMYKGFKIASKKAYNSIKLKYFNKRKAIKGVRNQKKISVNLSNKYLTTEKVVNLKKPKLQLSNQSSNIASKKSKKSIIKFDEKKKVKKFTLNKELKIQKSRKFIQDKKSRFKKLNQKKKIKRAYALAVRNKYLKQKRGLKQRAKDFAKLLIKVLTKTIKNFGIALMTILLLIIILFQSCVTCVGGIGSVVASSYQADDEPITDADVEFTAKEAALVKEIFDLAGSYRQKKYKVEFDLAPIGHDPQELIALLTVLFEDFKLNDVKGMLERIFKLMYHLTEHKWTTKKEVPGTDPGTGHAPVTPKTKEEKHVKIILERKSWNDILEIIWNEEGLNVEDKEYYDVLMEHKGNFQFLLSPLPGPELWRKRIIKMHGWHYEPSKKKIEFFNGIRLGVNGAEQIFAPCSGTIVNSDNGYITIEQEDKTVINIDYAMLTKAEIGEKVKVGDEIGIASPPQGKHYIELSYQTKKQGFHLNPYFYIEDIEINNKPNKGGGVPPTGQTHIDGENNKIIEIPTLPITDENVKALITEANKHLGKPYKYGANGPDKFDCSSFVAWVFRNSGVKPKMYRTTAQGIYNNFCNPVSSQNVEPGDIVFFQGTNSDSPNRITHLGIYVGNGMMIHAGLNGVEYTKINNKYWQNHFYAYGRPK